MRITQCSSDHVRPTLGSVGGTLPLLAWILFAAVGDPTQTVVAQDKTGTVQTVLNPLVDVNGIVPTDPSTPLYSRIENPRAAVVAPDGHHITLGEWQSVGGVGHLTRTSQGTQVDLELTGLVPKGVYTAWALFFRDPPFNFSPVANFAANVAEGAVGADDGSESRFVADANGTATYTALIPPGPLSIDGGTSTWALDGFSSLAVVGFYHIDGQTHGPVPGPLGVGAFSVGFVPEPSSIAIALLAAGGLGFAVWRRKGESIMSIASRSNRTTWTRSKPQASVDNSGRDLSIGVASSCRTVLRRYLSRG